MARPPAARPTNVDRPTLFPAIHAIFKFVKPCLFCAQLFFGIHWRMAHADCNVTENGPENWLPLVGDGSLIAPLFCCP